MALTLRAVGAPTGGYMNPATLAKPSGTVENDIMFALLSRDNSANPITPPGGWTLLGTSSGSYWLYYRVASASEPDSWDWTWTSNAYLRGIIVSFYGGFDTADPIDVVSNTDYVTSNTTFRAASMTLGATEPVVYFAATIGWNSASSFTPPSGFSEHYDGGSASTWHWHEIASNASVSSGATGDIDATGSSATTQKHAFAVALNPAASAQCPVQLLRHHSIGLGDFNV